MRFKKPSVRNLTSILASMLVSLAVGCGPPVEPTPTSDTAEPPGVLANELPARESRFKGVCDLVITHTDNSYCNLWIITDTKTEREYLLIGSARGVTITPITDNTE